MLNEGLASIDFITKSIFLISIAIPAIIFFAIHRDARSDQKKYQKKKPKK